MPEAAALAADPCSKEPAGGGTGRTPGRVSWRPGMERLRGLLRRASPDLTARAADRWMIAPGTHVYARPAKFLDGQLERIQGSRFGDMSEVVRDFRGGFSSLQPPTMGYRLTDVVLLDGVLYGAEGVRHLRQRTRLAPIQRVPATPVRAAMYESWPGNRWFGNWLLDDCLTYRLAEAVARPFTTNASIGHMTDYQAKLGMAPACADTAWFEELFLFEDRGHNAHKRDRADDLRERLVGPAPVRHPGVFLLRGQAGDQRVLQNEIDLAERLARTRGLRILDPLSSTLDEVLAACAGADIVAGVEGSQLVHGLMTMPRGAKAFVVQPPARAVSVLKLVTDRQEQDYAFTVGVGTNDCFRVDIEEVERTLDLP